MKAVIHKTGAIGEVLGIESRDGTDYVYFASGLSLPVSEVGFLTQYERYVEDCYDWSDFRREAAKDILCAIITSDTAGAYDEKCELAITISDELVRKLKENEQSNI